MQGEGRKAIGTTTNHDRAGARGTAGPGLIRATSTWTVLEKSNPPRTDFGHVGLGMLLRPVRSPEGHRSTSDSPQTSILLRTNLGHLEGRAAEHLINPGPDAPKPNDAWIASACGSRPPAPDTLASAGSTSFDRPGAAMVSAAALSCDSRPGARSKTAIRLPLRILQPAEGVIPEQMLQAPCSFAPAVQPSPHGEAVWLLASARTSCNRRETSRPTH